MRTSGKQLGNAGCLEAELGKAKGGSESSTTGSNDDCIIGMVDNGVLVSETALNRGEAKIILARDQSLEWSLQQHRRNAWCDGLAYAPGDCRTREKLF